MDDEDRGCIFGGCFLDYSLILSLDLQAPLLDALVREDIRRREDDEVMMENLDQTARYLSKLREME